MKSSNFTIESQFGLNDSNPTFVPAYTQVVTLTVYAYLFSTLFAQQYLEPRTNSASTDNQTFSRLNISFTHQGVFSAHTPCVYIPWFSILEFIGYLGWVKVAETLLNPWGDDDEDFQINYLIDRNFQVESLRDILDQVNYLTILESSSLIRNESIF
jgi:hypothetical protein